MAFKYRSDLVGKRFLCIYANHCSDHYLENLKTTTNSNNKNSQTFNKKCSDKCFSSIDKLKQIEIKNWPWKSGIIRASSHRDSHNPDLSVLVEFDSQCWQKREWIKIYEQDRFQLFLIEYILVWNNRKQTIFNNVLNWPALNFKIYVDKIGFNECLAKPIEYLDDKQLDFVIYDELKKFEEISLDQEKSTIENNNLRLCVNEWADFQKQQKVLLKTPSILMGYRVQVYRAIGTTQWFTAVIKSYDENTKELILTDDTVLEEHYEDPTLVQMKLIGDGVINSILKGEDQGIVPRRRACTQNVNSSTYNNSRRTNNSSNSFTLSSSNSSSISVNSINSQQLNNLNSNSNCNINSNLNSKTAASTYVTTNSSFSSTHLSSNLNKNFKNVLSNETKFTPIYSTSNLLSSSFNDSSKLLSNSSETIKDSTVFFINNDSKTGCKLNSGLNNFNSLQAAKKKTQKTDTDDVNNLNDDGLEIKNSHQRNNKINKSEDKSKDKTINDLLSNSNIQNPVNNCTKAEFIDLKNSSIENILKNTTNKKSSIKQSNHFRPAPMLSQVTKSKSSTYLMQLNKPNNLQQPFVQNDTKNLNDSINAQSLKNFNSTSLVNLNNSMNNYTTFIPPLSSNVSNVKTKQNKIQKQSKNSINNLEDQASLSMNHSFNQLQAFNSSGYLGLWNHNVSINQLSNINQLINQDYKLSNNQTTTSSKQVDMKLDKKQQNIFNLLNSNVNIPNQVNSIIYEENKVLDCSSNNNSKNIGDILSQDLTKNLTAQQNSFVFNTNLGDKIDLNNCELKQNLGTQPIVPNKSYLIDSSINSLNFEIKQEKSKEIFSNNSLFSIASICKKELNNLEKINTSQENKSDKLSSIVVAENVDSNISESSSSNGQYKKLKNVWLHRHSQNNNDELNNKNNSTNPLELLADTSLKQHRDETDSMKQETDLNCKEKFKFSPFSNGDKKNDSDDTEEEEESAQKSIIRNDFDTSISSSSNNFSSDSETEDNKMKKKNVKKGRKNINSQAKKLNKKTHKNGKEAAKNSYKKSRLSKRSNKEVNNIIIDNNSQNSNCSSNSERESSIRSSALAATGKILSSKNTSNSNSKNLIEQPSIFSNSPVSLLKKTGESFLQDGSCAEVAPKLNRCRECRMTPNQRKKKIPNIFCRFYAFRKLKYGRNGILQSASFSKSEDANEQEIYFWLPKFLKKNKNQNLDFTTSLYLLQHVGDQLCDLINEELRAMKMHCGIDRSISWKRVVQGIREMCDVCETTLFNIHWTCHDCGFVLCIDCYGARLNCDGTPGDAVPPLSCDSSSNNGSDRDAYQWLLCQNDQPHEQSKLVMTQIVADRVLNDMAKKLHKIRSKLRIKCNSICCKDGTSSLNGLFFSDEECDENLSTSSEQSQNHQLTSSLNENMAASNLINSLINKPHNKENKNQLLNSSNVNNNIDLNITNTIKRVNKTLVHLTPDDEKRKALEFFALKRDRKLLNANYMPSRCCKVEQTRRKYPEVPHSWLCEGRLLCLENSSLNDKNLDLFQEQWLRGQPLIITGINEKLSNELWNPEQLSVKMTDFTCKGNGLYDCRTSNSVRIPLRRFWEGFENVNRRAKDSNGDPLILKLKDWPPGDDFCDLMPDHFSEFFDCIPLPIYTKREGKLNLAARLPDSFVRPDLGPKMYTAYGCDVNAPDVGTANLHLDVSDAVNVLVYVSVPKCKDDLQQKQLNYLLNLSDIDQITKKKIRDKDSKIGALWHIYEAKDADKIREFLKKVSAERGKPLAASMDPIHDQSWYLNEELRDRLRNEFNVNGYSIVQCLGDAVFIPAGSPHQVRNIHSAIKLACDFVSPENISRCFELTAQFRMLSNFHTNHEDKLQVKNIIYHAIKDALTVLDLESQLLPSNYLESHFNRETSLENYEESLLSNQQEVFVEENKRDALKSANLNEGITNKNKAETITNKRNKNSTNERAKRSKLNENKTQPQNIGNDLNNNSPKRKRDELAETKTFKKNRKEHKKTIKLKS